MVDAIGLIEFEAVNVFKYYTNFTSSNTNVKTKHFIILSPECLQPGPNQLR